MSSSHYPVPSSQSDFIPSRAWWSGIALVLAILSLAFWLSSFEYTKSLGLGVLTFSIVVGMLLGNTAFPPIAAHTAAGVDFCKTRLLRAGIVLFGFRLTFQEAAAIGWEGIVLDAAVILSVFCLAVALGPRVFGLDRQTSMLVGAGSAICGAAAVMAMEPVTRAQDHKVSVAVATVVVFGTISMFLYPVLYPFSGMSEQAFGVFIGSTVHEVAQVVAAGNAIGPAAAKVAVVEKMVRVMMLAPFLIVVSWWLHRRRCAETDGIGSAKPGLPWFALGFIATVGINSSGLVPPQAANVFSQTSTVLLGMAMAALGLRTHVSAVRQAGVAPLGLAGVLFMFLVAGGYGMNLLAAKLA